MIYNLMKPNQLNSTQIDLSITRNMKYKNKIKQLEPGMQRKKSQTMEYERNLLLKFIQYTCENQIGFDETYRWQLNELCTSFLEVSMAFKSSSYF